MSADTIGMNIATAADGRELLDRAAQLLARGRVDEARAQVAGVISVRPRLAEAHRLLGDCLQQAGDIAGAEAAFRTGLKLAKGDAATAISLSDLLVATARQPESERVLRAALEANRRSAALLARLARQMTAAGRPEEALRLIGKTQTDAAADHAVLVEHAAALKALGRLHNALAIHERAAALFPDSAVAHHNLAANRGDLGRHAAAEQSAARAMAKGGNAPQTWLVYARALLGQGKLDAAERAFRETIRRAPAYVEAQRDLAQLIWMRTEDPRAAVGPLDAAIRAHPQSHQLYALRATILHHAGLPDAAYATLKQALSHHAEEPALLMSASQQAAICGHIQDALGHAERAAGLMPDDHTAQSVLFTACVAMGQAERAGSIAESLVRRRPHDQRALAYQATAWRLLGDPRYASLYDYAAFVRAWRMDVPDGWPSLEAYLADLTQALGGLHPFRTHPLDQSLRHGSQATHLLQSDDPVIRAFFQAVDGPIRRHLAELGRGRDPVRARNSGSHRFHGAWSVRLREGGFHTDHIHPEGWLSSACYIALPQTQADGREAWIKFGEPGIRTIPALGAEHFIKPEPGMLVLFPSFMWHGTVPFTTGGLRLSVAFDLLP